VSEQMIDADGVSI